MDWTVFGKTPFEGDFVRDNLRSPLAVALFRWLSDGVGHAGRWTKALPASGIKFVVTFRAAPGRALAGVMIPSRDRVGREFPLVACVEGPSAMLTRCYPAAPIAWNERLSAARKILELGQSLPLSDLVGRLKSLSPLSALDDTYVRTMHALSVAPTREFHERLFADPVHDPFYAYQTVRVAIHTLGRGSAPALVCPIASPTDMVAWLELVRRLAACPDFVPSFFWTVGERPTVVVCLDDPPVSLVAVLGGAEGETSKVWPLSTVSALALERARTSIAPLMPPETAPFEAVLSALSSR